MMAEKAYKRKCTVYPFHPWDRKDNTKHGVVLWVPHSIEALVESAVEHLKVSMDSFLFLTEDAAKILDVNMICDNQKLYLITESQ
ncbi:hypothetical protein LIER_30777 [Lithospermum erythrorhizon]|uniref:KHA domain-containing protein n=1 Tax=Lithospermum erythrorhizon TaxID=34254 RepID=A0AAV3RPE8_LITER